MHSTNNATNNATFCTHTYTTTHTYAPTLYYHQPPQVERALRVLDGAVAVFDSVAGVEPQSETVWRQADKYKVPRICFVNKMDRMGANFFRTRDMVVSNLGANPLVIQLPIGAEDTFEGIIDLVKMQEVVWTGEELGAKFEYRPIRDDMQAQAAEYREMLLDAVVELDDDVMEAYLEVCVLGWRCGGVG